MSTKSDNKKKRKSVVEKSVLANWERQQFSSDDTYDSTKLVEKIRVDLPPNTERSKKTTNILTIPGQGVSSCPAVKEVGSDKIKNIYIYTNIVYITYDFCFVGHCALRRAVN